MSRIRETTFGESQLDNFSSYEYYLHDIESRIRESSLILDKFNEEEKFSNYLSLDNKYKEHHLTRINLNKYL